MSKKTYLINTTDWVVVAVFATMADCEAVEEKVKYDVTEVTCEEDFSRTCFNLKNLVGMYNTLTGQEVKKFGSMASGAKRLWAAMEAHEFAAVKTRPTKGTDAVLVQAEEEKGEYRAGTKFAKLIDALSKDGGSTLAELAAVTGWKEPTVQAYFYYDVKRKGYGVERKAHGEAAMTYHLIS